jgi:hypothetical protein
MMCVACRADPGLVKVSVPEARRLLRLATTPMTATARQPGHAWRHWRRRHQARVARPSKLPSPGPPRSTIKPGMAATAVCIRPRAPRR